MNNARNNYPHEAELFDKYPRIYDKVISTIDLLKLVLQITLWVYAISIITLIVTLISIR